MKKTCTRPSDYPRMIQMAVAHVGSPAIEAIDAFAVKYKVAHHRAGKVFWELADAALIVTARGQDEIEMITDVF